MSGEAEPWQSEFGSDVPSDVEDYISVNEGEPSLPWDIFVHVFDLVKNGNQAFRENCFEEVDVVDMRFLEEYTRCRESVFIDYIP